MATIKNIVAMLNSLVTVLAHAPAQFKDKQTQQGYGVRATGAYSRASPLVTALCALNKDKPKSTPPPKAATKKKPKTTTAPV